MPGGQKLCGGKCLIGVRGQRSGLSHWSGTIGDTGYSRGLQDDASVQRNTSFTFCPFPLF